MTRTSRFLGGLGTSYAHQVAVTLVGLWLTPFLLGRLGSHEYGLWLIAAQFVTYLALLDLGVLALLPRETAYAVGRAGGVSAAAHLSEVVGRTAWLVLWQLPLIAGAAAAVWWSVPAEWAATKTPLAIILGAFVLTYPLRISQAVLQGCQDLAFVGGLNFVAWLAGIGATVFFVLQGWGMVALATGAALTQVIALGGCSYRLVRRFGHAVPRSWPSWSWRQVWPDAQKALWMSVGQIAQVLIFATDVFLIAWMFGPVAVVSYACTQKLIAVLTNQPQIIMQAAAPALGELRMSASRSKMFEVTSSLSIALMLASGAVLVLVLATNQAFVSWWVGEEQYGGMLLTLVFASGMLVRHWNTALVYSLVAFGYERRVSLTNAADGIITLACAVTLAQMFGVIGVPLGLVCGALLVSVPFNGGALARDTGVSRRELVSALQPWAVRLVIIVPLAIAAGMYRVPAGVVAVAVLAAAMILLYSALMLPIALRPPLRAYVHRATGHVLGRWMPAGRRAAPGETSAV